MAPPDDESERNTAEDQPSRAPGDATGIRGGTQVRRARRRFRQRSSVRGRCSSCLGHLLSEIESEGRSRAAEANCPPRAMSGNYVALDQNQNANVSGSFGPGHVHGVGECQLPETAKLVTSSVVNSVFLPFSTR